MLKIARQYAHSYCNADGRDWNEESCSCVGISSIRDESNGMSSARRYLTILSVENL
jgi:hypothetical protein